MFLQMSEPVPPIALPVATVARPSLAQKVDAPVPLNQQESLLISGLTTWQSAYTKATAAALSVPLVDTRIFPQYGFLPPSPGLRLSWRYGTGSHKGLPAAYVCLAGAYDAPISQAVAYATRFFASQGYYQGGACGVASPGVGNVLTLWLQPAPAALKALRAAAHPAPVPPNASSASPGAIPVDPSSFAAPSHPGAGRAPISPPAKGSAKRRWHGRHTPGSWPDSGWFSSW